MDNIIGGNIGPSLTTVISRVEKLNAEKKAVQDDINVIFSEARDKGLNIKTIREVIKLRKLDQAEREEQEHLRDVYLRAMGLLDLGGE